jgi:hypothetical protein
VFQASERREGWFVGDGVVQFGPYPSQARALASAAALNALRETHALSPAELVDRQGRGAWRMRAGA